MTKETFTKNEILKAIEIFKTINNNDVLITDFTNSCIELTYDKTTSYNRSWLPDNDAVDSLHKLINS